MRSNRIDEALYGRKYSRLTDDMLGIKTTDNCGCQSSMNREGNATADLKKFLSQFFDASNLKFEVLEISSDAKTRSFFMTVDTKTHGVLNFSSNTTEIGNKGLFLSTVTVSDTVGVQRYEVMLQQTGSETFILEKASVIGGIEPTGGHGTLRLNWGQRYTHCIGRMLNTDEYGPGQVIVVLGILGGAGCFACGAAAATIFGFGALGCLAV